MDAGELIVKTADWVRQEMQVEGSHDWFHVERVWKLSRHIIKSEPYDGPDGVVVELAALLHDIADAKFHEGDESIGPRRARQWLEALANRDKTRKLSLMQIDHIVSIIATMSFRHGQRGFEPDPADREYAIVRDADRLDAMGAIGIARAFAYGGASGRPLHVPEVLSDGASTISHFNDKLLGLKDLMLTDTGRQLADGRHKVLVDFVARFMAEWDGNF